MIDLISVLKCHKTPFLKQFIIRVRLIHHLTCLNIHPIIIPATMRIIKITITDTVTPAAKIAAKISIKGYQLTTSAVISK